MSAEAPMPEAEAARESVANLPGGEDRTVTANADRETGRRAQMERLGSRATTAVSAKGSGDPAHEPGQRCTSCRVSDLCPVSVDHQRLDLGYREQPRDEAMAERARTIGEEGPADQLDATGSRVT